jgi:hypothetical protein
MLEELQAMQSQIGVLPLGEFSDEARNKEKLIKDTISKLKKLPGSKDNKTLIKQAENLYDQAKRAVTYLIARAGKG